MPEATDSESQRAAPAPATTEQRAEGPAERPGRNDRRLAIIAWVVFAVIAALALLRPLVHDFRDEPLAGDEASHVLQTLSIAYAPHTLNFDQHDIERWRSLDWAASPVGLFFQRYEDDLYAAAKPYGYSLYAAPFVAVLGAVSGLAVANTLLLALLLGLSALMLLTRYRGAAVPLAVGAFFLASYAYMYAYWNHSELFLALLVLVAFGAAVRFRQTAAAPWALISFAAMGFGMSEKAAYITLFAPIALVMLWKADRNWLRAGMLATAIGVFAVAIVPYLHYSDGASFTPYGGDERLYVQSRAPFAADATGDGYASTSFEATSLVNGITEFSPGNTARSVFHTATGRYTGLLVYMPLALLLIGAGIARFRRADAWGRAAVLSVLGYIAFYAVMFPANYFGGGHSLGNRYFLQVAPAVLAMTVLVGVSRRTLIATSVVGAALGIAMLWPQHMDPDAAHVNIERTSPPQRLLPLETNQSDLQYVICAKHSVTHVTTCR